MSQQIQIGKARFGAVIEGIACRVKLPALWFGHKCFDIQYRHPELVSG